MDRRTFVLLTGAASGTMLIPRARGIALPVEGRRPIGRLRFTLDDDRRWSLWYQGGGAPVPVIEDAELGVWVGDRFVALGDLEDTAIGTRRPPTGESLVVRGRGAEVYVEAEFVTSESRDAPLATVTVSLYPDRTLPACQGVRFFQVPAARVLPDALPTPLRALINGYDSRGDCQIAVAGPATDLISHGALGLTRGRRGLGLSFDPGEPGEAKVRFRDDTLEAVSDWLPARPLRPQGDGSTLRLCLNPDADGLVALAALFEPTSAVDQERLAALAAPAGWRSGGVPDVPVTEAAVLANLDFCATHFSPTAFRYIQIDDGYQLTAGNWDVNAGFPSGHRGLTERIHARGFRAGLWMAPFAVAEASRVPAEHPEWLVRTGDGPTVFDERASWGGRVYGLDGTHPEVQQWLYALGRRTVREWGYDYLLADCLAWTAPTAHHGGLTHAEAFRRGLSALREGLGPDALLVGAGAPLQHAVGLVNAMRIGSDVDPSWGAIRSAARAAGLRSFYQRGAWINDPGAVLVGAPLTESEARAWASVVAVSGGATLSAGDLTTLPAERVAILQRVLPVAPVAGRPVDALTAEGGVAGVWVAAGTPRWWTVALVNWDDVLRDLAVPLADLGIKAARLEAYDVWRNAPLAEVRQRLAATVEPHGTLTVALRPVANHPQVIGTTRHVVQGAVDLVEEQWEPATRTLRAKSTMLDAGAYAVTLAVPAGLRPLTCTAEPPCEVERLPSGHVVLRWAAGGDGRDITWAMQFRATLPRKAGTTRGGADL